MSNWVNSVGLVLDIIGAIILFRYGLPEQVSRTGQGFVRFQPSPTDYVALAVQEAEIAKAQRYDRWGKFGLMLLILGFVLQLIGNWL